MLGGIKDGAQQAVQLAALAREAGLWEPDPDSPGGVDFTPSTPEADHWSAATEPPASGRGEKEREWTRAACGL